MAVNFQDLIRAIETCDMDSLWRLALIDPVGVFRKISARQIGTRRVAFLLGHIRGMDQKTLEANKSFLVLVKNLCLEEIGSGLFTKDSLKGFSKPQGGGKQPPKTFMENEQLSKRQKGENVPKTPLRDSDYSSNNVSEPDKLKHNIKQKKTVDESDEHLEIRREIIDYLNEKAGKNFRYNTKAHNSLINSRLQDGYTIDDFKKVIDNQVSVWLDNLEMNAHLSPPTLFRPSNFEKYLNSMSADLKRKFNGIQTGNPNGKPDNKYEKFYL